MTEENNMPMDEYNKNQFPYNGNEIGGNDAGDDIINNLSDAYDDDDGG